MTSRVAKIKFKYQPDDIGRERWSLIAGLTVGLIFSGIVGMIIYHYGTRHPC